MGVARAKHQQLFHRFNIQVSGQPTQLGQVAQAAALCIVAVGPDGNGGDRWQGFCFQAKQQRKVVGNAP